jgi:AraC-like DNA-binding protein
MQAGIYSGERFGRDRCASGTIPRHRHGFGYVCLVLQGRFVEAGDIGRFRLQAGDALVHRPYEAHLDHFDSSAAEVLNLPLVEGMEEGLLKVPDPDAVARAAERDPREAAHLLISTSTPGEGETDWPDLLAAALQRSPALALGDWAQLHGLAPATVSRGFRRAYGASPARYRADARARRACHALVTDGRALAGVAADLGFADQAHMCRAVKCAAGLSPGRLRREGQMRSIPA